VLVLDAVLLFTFLTASRFTFRLLRRALPGGDLAFAPSDQKRVLIYGAGDGGELLLRELRNNVRWGCRPSGFLDDDPLKVNKVIHGLRVFGGNGTLLETCERQNVDEVLISSLHISEGQVLEIYEDCSIRGIAVRRMRFHREPVNTEYQPQPIGAGVSDTEVVDLADERWRSPPRGAHRKSSFD
jgi:UDP-GlcNAc:undecaprenyl-phosphate GlcNAc-1-phosphate transferase